ncbi:MAG: hypothetical protein R3E10_02525 [Gemmatimonadota bacterium]
MGARVAPLDGDAWTGEGAEATAATGAGASISRSTQKICGQTEHWA